MVCSSFNDLSSRFRDRDFTQGMLGRVRYLDERMPRISQFGHHPIKRAVAHEDLLLLSLHRDEELSSGERTMLTKDRESLPLRAGQAVVDRGKLFQMTL